MKDVHKPAAFPARWDPDWLGRRQRIEVDRLGYAGPDLPACPKPTPLAYRLLEGGLRATGLYQRGYRNFTSIALNRIDQMVPSWPKVLDGYRILQLSDLHIDLDPGLLEPLCRILAGVECELAVFTGDFWQGSRPGFELALSQMDLLLKCLPPPRDGCYGILGNHDAAALGAALESRGLPILVNEAVTLDAGGACFALAGVDDPYLFELADVARAAAACPAGLPRILLSHSPQTAPAAGAHGFHLMLSGHTHGGQVCLPGGRTLVRMPTVPRRFFRGRWRHGLLIGYTTTGTGACHLPVRFNCPPEVVLHILHPAPH